MKEIVIISGKGGTGKTSLAASFAYLARKHAVIADCDVDASDMHLLLDPDFEYKEDYYSGELAFIDQNLCTACGKCQEICRFDAIKMNRGAYQIDPLDCEGCGYCLRICPVEAIGSKQQWVGQLYISHIKSGSTMVHAKLGIGADNSGKLVARVKSQAREVAMNKNIELVVVDGSPGIGCPVISSLSGAHFVVLVTEPSVSGLHDLQRVYEVVENFKIPAGCIINKADTYPELTQQIESFLQRKNILHIASFPYDETFTKAMTRGETIVEYMDNGLSGMVSESWNRILNHIKQIS